MSNSVSNDISSTMPNHKPKPWWRLGIFSVLLALTSMDAHGAQIANTASYVVNLAGINVASVAINFKDNGTNYSVDIGADVMGVGTLVAKGRAAAASIGSSANGQLRPSKFDLSTRASNETFSVDVQYASGNATGFKVEPPLINHAGRVALERSHMRGVGDPIAAFIIKADKLSPQMCNQRLKVFTGMERYDLAMTFAAEQEATSKRTGYQGPVILCHLKYLPIAGHFADSEITKYLAESEKMLVWFAPLKDTGYFIPYRILLGTSAGDLSMVMTDLN